MPLGRPGRGKPSPIRLTGVFLPDPREVMKLEERPLSSWARSARDGTLSGPTAMKLKGLEALLKAEQRVDTLAKAQRVARGFVGMMGDLPVVHSLKRALAGDLTAQKKLRLTGDWHAFQEGWMSSIANSGNDVRNVLDLIIAHGVEIEAASAAATRCLAENRFRETAECMTGEERLAGFLSQPALALFHGAKSPADVLPARAAGLCAFLLSQVAWIEHYLLQHYPKTAFDARSTLLGGKGDELNLSGALLRWLLGQAGFDSINAFLKHARYPGDERALWRWQSGTHFPTETRFVALRDSVLEQVAMNERSALGDRMDIHFWAARRLERTRHIAQVFFIPEGVSAQLLPGASASDWVRQRYPDWLQRWRSRPLLTADL